MPYIADHLPYELQLHTEAVYNTGNDAKRPVLTLHVACNLTPCGHLDNGILPSRAKFSDIPSQSGEQKIILRVIGQKPECRIERPLKTFI